MDCFRERAAAWISAHQEEIIAEIQGFVRIRSVSRHDCARKGAPYGDECRKMLDFALSRAQEMGFKTEDHEGYCASAVSGDGKNAIGILGHLDVVPEGGQWLYPPYAGTRAGDFLIGRGVRDNKSAVVLGLYLMRLFRETETPLRHGLRVIMGCAEETGMQDMVYYAKHYPHPVFSLVPDSNFPANFAQKGTLGARLKIALGENILSFNGGLAKNMVPPDAHAALAGVDACAFASLDPAIFTVKSDNGVISVAARGTAAHAARPEKGKSAIFLLADALCASGALSGQDLHAMRAIREITSDHFGRNAGIASEDPDTGKSTMVLGHARTVDGSVQMTVDCRLSLNADRAENARAFRTFAENLGFALSDLRTGKPVFIPKDDWRIQLLQDVFFDVTQNPLPPYTTGGGTYQRVLPNAVTYGLNFPGNRPRPCGIAEHDGSAHAPNEFLHIPSFLTAMEIYACAVHTLDKTL